MHEIPLRDAEGVFERPGRTRRHDVLVVLQAWPRGEASLDELDDQDRVNRGLDGDAAGLTLTLTAVAVAKGEERTIDVHPEVAGRAGPHLGCVHVAAVRVGHQRRAYLAAGRCHADRPMHRVE